MKGLKLAAGVLVLAGAVWVITGCESGKGTGINSLNVVPASVTITGDVKTVTFVVAASVVNTNNPTGDSGLRPLSLPLEWSVANPELGHILDSSGQRATYMRTSKNGVNTVIVRDQYGAEGYGVVEQR